MNKTELIKAVARDSGLYKKDVEKMLDSLTDVIGNELIQGNRVKIINFGSFIPVTRKSRNGYNPKKLEHIHIDEKHGCKFKPSNILLEAMNS